MSGSPRPGHTAEEFGISIIGVGGYVPTRPITNDYLASTTGLSPEEIVKRTGVEMRYIVAEGDTASRAGVPTDTKRFLDASAVVTVHPAAISWESLEQRWLARQACLPAVDSMWKPWRLQECDA